LSWLMAVLSLGEAFAEFVKEQSGKLEEVGTFHGPYPSGAPAITASAIAKMGGRSKFIATVGDDAFGHAFIDRLKRDGVDTSAIRLVKNRTTGMAFVSRLDGGRTFLFHARDSATALLGPEDVSLDGATVLHVSGSSLSMGWKLARAVRRAVAEAKERGITFSFDPNVRTEVMSEADAQELRRMTFKADLLLMGEEDVKSLFAGDPRQLARKLSFGKTVVLKRGVNGSLLYREGQERPIRVFRMQEVDATGAGDWFNGAFLTMLERGEDAEFAAEFASAAAAISVTKMAPIDGPDDKAQVLELMSKKVRVSSEDFYLHAPCTRGDPEEVGAFSAGHEHAVPRDQLPLGLLRLARASLAGSADPSGPLQGSDRGLDRGYRPGPRHFL